MKKIKRCLADDGYWKRKPCTEECPYFDTCAVKGKTERLLELQETEKELKATNRHDIGELKLMQGYSFERKLQLSKQRVDAWVEWWDYMVYIAESGGKDSKVLTHFIHEYCGYPDIPTVFVNTGLEYDSVREHGIAIASEVLKPRKNFVQVIKEYGYPIISKEVAQAIYECQKAKAEGKEMPSYRLEKLNGTYIDPKTGTKSNYNMEKYEFLLDAPFRISHMCCKQMKKNPSMEYERRTGRKPFLGLLADESRLRRSKWVKEGCNAFYNDRPTSTPLSFWTEQDILQYIKKYNLEIPSIYGDIVQEDKDGQYDMFNLRLTGEPRTGCVFCLFSIASDKEKLLRLKKNEPQKYDYVMRGGKFDETGMWIPHQGLGYKFVCDWLNEHGNIGIKY